MFIEVLAPDKKTELLENLKKITASASIITTKALGQSMTLLRLQVLCGNMFHQPGLWQCLIKSVWTLVSSSRYRVVGCKEYPDGNCFTRTFLPQMLVSPLWEDLSKSSVND
ncbi:N-terminal acetyltransferase B complex auxiliary subunit NAA25, partial [Cucurbita argyrosperma subsp. sororia]